MTTVANNIEFVKLSLKNFLSVGNEPLILNFKNGDGSNTVINFATGSNGTGKSSLLCDGVSFALFGKSVRGVNKNSLINNITQGNTVVEIEFIIGGHDYIIKRGIKPTFLELYKEGELLNITAMKQDTQTYINSHILRFGFNVFTQTIVLTSMLYQSFMTMNAGTRRKYIENITGLNIITNALLMNKDNLGVVNGEIDLLQTDIDKINIKKSGNKQLLLTNDEMCSNIKQQIKEIEEQIETLKSNSKNVNDNETLQKELNNLSEELKDLTLVQDELNKEYENHQNELEKLSKVMELVNDTKWQDEMIEKYSIFKNEMEYHIEQWQDFIESAKYSLNLLNDKIKLHSSIHNHSNDEQCDYCNSHIMQTDDINELLHYKEMITAGINTYTDKIKQAQQGIKSSSEMIIKERNGLINEYQEKYNNTKQEINNHEQKIKHQKQLIDNNIQMYEKLKKQNEEHEQVKDNQIKNHIEIYQGNIGKFNQQLQEYVLKINNLYEEITKYDEKLANLNKELAKKTVIQSVMNNTTELLAKDTGGLYSIIEQNFIKLLNYTINKNLKTMGFGGMIYFDENYKETIYSYTKKDVVYNSLSAGERMRIDIALIFTWQEILSKISNVKSNLFIIDEIADNVLDDEGINAFKKLLLTGENMNIFIITHNHSFIDKFTDDSTSNHDILINMIKMKKVNSFTTYEQTNNI